MQAAIVATQAAAMVAADDGDLEEVDPTRDEDEAALQAIIDAIEVVAAEFPRGTVVTLKCGSPKMVVARIFYDDEMTEPEVMLEVEWFDCKTDYSAANGQIVAYPQWGEARIRNFAPDVCQKA